MPVYSESEFITWIISLRVISDFSSNGKTGFFFFSRNPYCFSEISMVVYLGFFVWVFLGVSVSHVYLVLDFMVSLLGSFGKTVLVLSHREMPKSL